MAEQDAFAQIIQHPEFQQLSPDQQVGLLTQVIQSVRPDIDPAQISSFAERQIRINRPRSAFERAGSFLTGFIPIVGPILQRFAFQEEVRPPELLSLFGIVDDDSEQGYLIRAGLDIPLLIFGSIAGSAAVKAVAPRFLPSLLNRSIPALIGRELIAGAASGTGELILDPPHSVAEGVARLGLSAVGQAAFTTAGRLGLQHFRNLSFRRDLFNEFGDETRFAEFADKVERGDFRSITDAEISAYEKALGNRKDEQAIADRERLFDIVKKRNQSFEEERIENLRIQEAAKIQTEKLNEQLSAQQMQASLREADIRAQEEIALARARSEFQQQLIQQQVQTEQQIAQRFVDEIQREKEINRLIENVKKAPIERGDNQFLKSERMLIDLLDDIRVHGGKEQKFAFVNDEPITLPIAMIQDMGEGRFAAVVVDNIEANRAHVRSIGNVARATLRLPKDAEEIAAVRRIEIEQNIKPPPTGEEAVNILQLRVDAERKTRLANLNSLRFESESGPVQRDIFTLRRDAAENFLRASNVEIEAQTFSKLKSIPSLNERRKLASIEGLNPNDAEQVGIALRSAGFENVRISLDPNGRFEIIFSNLDNPQTFRAASLYAKNVHYRGIVDPTSNSTYSGLSIEEHAELARAFGFSKEQQTTFENFVNFYTKELRDRGIRFPVQLESLGIKTIEQQLSEGAKRPMRIPPSIIAQSGEIVRLIQPGDVIEYQGSKGKQTLYVVNKDQTPNPNGARNGSVVYETIPAELLDQFQQGQNIPTIRLTEEQLQRFGAKRSVEFPISSDVQSKFTLDSPSRFMGDLFGINRATMSLPVVDAMPNSIRQAASELGMKVSVSKSGNVRLSGQKIDLTNLTLEDAAHILTRLRQMRQDRITLLNFFEGCL